MQGSKIAIICLLLALTGCAGQAGKTGGTPVPDPESPGARVYAERCGSCHALPHPARLTYAGWLRLLPLMERRMAERQVPPLSGRERSVILAYLQEHAR